MLRYRAETEEEEVTPPKPRHLPPLEGDRPSSSSGAPADQVEPSSSAAASRGETEDQQSPASPPRPAPPAGPKPAGGAPPKPGRHLAAASGSGEARQEPTSSQAEDQEEEDEAEDSEAAREFRKREEANNATSATNRFETRKSLAATSEYGATTRGYIDHLYVQVEQQQLWKKLERSGTNEEEEDTSRTRQVKLSTRSSMNAISFKPQLKSLNTSAFDRIEAEDDDDDEDDEEPEEEVKQLMSAKDKESVVRRQSAFILNMAEMFDMGAADGGETTHTEEKGETGGSGGDEREGSMVQGDGPGSAPESDARMVVEPQKPEPQVEAPPHPLKELLTAKKMKIKDIKEKLKEMGPQAVAEWMEVPVDPTGKTPAPKPLVVAVAENNPDLVALLIENGANATLPFDGAGMYKGWVKPGCSLAESAANRKGRFVGTMLADKLTKIEDLLKSAVEAEAKQAEASKGKKETLNVEEVSDKQQGRRSFSYRDEQGFATRHTQGHPKDVYEIVEHLGDGDTSTVWGGWHKESMSSVAIKTEAKSDEAGIWDEINIMRKIQHPNISSLYETFENDTQVFMVLELCSGGRLYDAIGLNSEGTAEAHTARHPGVVKQLAEAVAFLHQNQICHRDVQLENFLLDKPVKEHELHQAKLKLIDFTTAKDYSSGQELVTKVCTPIYVAREILTRRMEPYTEKVDIWSLGVLFFILVSGHPPFAGSTDFDILKKVKKANWSFEPAKNWEGASEEMKDLISKMICGDANDRLSAQEVLSHPFLKNV